jgi:dTMP kinase
VAEVIRPGLAAGRLVVSDRYVESSLAYQGYGRGLSLDAIRRVADLATGGLRPDLIILIDLPIEEGLLRVGRRGGHDRMESEVREFHERVWAGYQALRAREPSRWALVSGDGSEDAVAERLWAALETRGFLAGLAGAGGTRGGR